MAVSGPSQIRAAAVQRALGAERGPPLEPRIRTVGGEVRTRNNAFGPKPTRQPSSQIKAPRYLNPEERGQRFVSKGRQSPSLDYEGPGRSQSRGPRQNRTNLENEGKGPRLA